MALDSQWQSAVGKQGCCVSLKCILDMELYPEVLPTTLAKENTRWFSADNSSSHQLTVKVKWCYPHFIYLFIYL